MSVEIIGRAVIAPGANSPSELFSILRQGKCVVTEVPDDRWDKARYWHPKDGVRGKTYSFAAGIVEDCFRFDPAAFNMSTREAQLLDPQQRLLLQTTLRALEDANLDPSDLRSQRVGVYVGASGLDHGNLIVEDPAAAGPYFMTGNTLSIVSNRVSHIFGLNGPSLTVDTACSSSLVALDLAMKALEAGEVDVAIVGGVNVLTHPLAFVGFAQAHMLSPEGLCRAYDENGQGYVRAEGASTVVLRRTDVAKANGDRSHARILVTRVNSAGRTNGISLPSREAQAQLLGSIYGEGRIDPNSLAFVEGHGTGTRVGDPAEIWSIGTVIGSARRAPLPLGSIKTNIGHAEPASGLMGLMKAMLSLEHNVFPASLHFETPNRSVDFRALNVHVAADAIELLHGKHPRLAGINSFGFGGTNAHVVISDPEAPPAMAPEDMPQRQIFTASAHTEGALARLLADYRTQLRTARASQRKSIISASGANRAQMRHRFVMANCDAASLDTAIETFLSTKETPAAVVSQALQTDVPIAFVFSGNGSQWAGMAVEAYRNNPSFRDRLNVINALFRMRSEIDIVELLFDPDLEAKLRKTSIAQPLLFAVQATLADVLGIEGVRPHAVFGHSVGEIAAAYVAGAISLVDAVSIIAKRSHHQERLAGVGRMIAVQLPPDQARKLCTENGLDDLCVAAVNARNSVTISGPTEQVLALREKLRSARVVAQLLDIDYAFHHPSIETARDGFLAEMAELTLRPTQVPFISAVTGGVLAGNLLTADYWWRNLRDPVLFEQATQAALDVGCRLFVEIGPRPILLNYVKDTIRAAGVPAGSTPTFVKDESVADPVARAHAKIIAHGGAYDRRKAFGARNAAITLPGLPFELLDLRHEFTSDALDLYGRHKVPHTLAGWRVDRTGASWKNHIDSRIYPDLADHVVDGQAILPGSGFLDMALSAARDFYGTDRIELSNFELLRALPLSDTLLEVSTVLSPETGDIRINSRERLSSEDWALHAVARCRVLGDAARGAASAPLKRARGQEIDALGAYQTATAFGLNYGPAFRLLEKVRKISERMIDVDLLPPQASDNRFITYALHPIATDAAFHGLVAMFGSLSGQTRGAPYIPIRFGTVRLLEAGRIPTRARIEVSRVSALSISIDVTLVDAGGQVIATLEGCRFKRTWVRQPRTLDDVAIHQVAVPRSTLPEVSPTTRPKMPRRHVMPAPAETQADDARQMLNAAIYRACHDFAVALSPLSQEIEVAELPGGRDFRYFMANCLTLLEDVQLGVASPGGWTYVAGCSLPPVGSILNALSRERPDLIAEIVAVNTVHAEVMQMLRLHKRLGSSSPPEKIGQPVGEAMLEHLLLHTGTTRIRTDLLRSALRRALEDMAPGALRIVEIGSVSKAFSLELASICEEARAEYVVVEPDEAAFSELSAGLQTNAWARVMTPQHIAALDGADIVVSASMQFLGIVRDHQDVARLLDQGLRDRGRLLLATPAPTILADFVYGVNEGWFERSQNIEFPVGSIAGTSEFDDLVQRLRLQDARIQTCETTGGQVLLVEGRAPPVAQKPVAPRPHAKTIAIVSRDAVFPKVTPRSAIELVRLTGDTDEDRSLVAASAAIDDEDAAARYAYIPSTPAGTDGGSGWLAATCFELGWIADALQAKAGNAKPALAVLLPGGAPDGATASAAASGVWTYLRVLRNEFPGIDIHAVDVGSADGAVSFDTVEGVLRAVDQGGTNTEWLLDPATRTVSELRAVPGPVASERRRTRRFKSATLRQGISSQIASLEWQETDPPEPRDNDVVIAVEATGLNFRDVMWAMGMLPEEALEDGFAGPTIGMECAGEVTAVGAAVTDIAVGDRVMAIAPAAFSTHVVVDRRGVAHLPEPLGATAGATLPVAFVTAYYALVELARIVPSETVLIHGGAGGVGLAALQVAKSRGATVIATAGTVEKRRILETFGADHVLDSRSLSFVDDVLSLTDGEGVDVVLNSLFGEAMERGISLVKPFGRFLELGKRDFYADTKIGLRPFRRNISYFGIDADQLLGERPDLGSRILSEIAVHFGRGDFSALPYRLFGHDEIAGAFRLMQASGHVGKILVRPPVAGQDAVSVRETPPPQLDADGVQIVIGGVGGFGLAAARWLVERGARRIALVTRRGVADFATNAALREWKALGVVASVHACDATEEAAVETLLAELRAQAPIKGVVHAAMVLDDALVENLTPERFRTVIDAKAKSADLFDRLTREDPISTFLLFSSATTLVGNPGQGNYVAANGYLEGLARARRREGLPALAVGFGAISDVGVLKRQADVGEQLSKRIGKATLTAVQALAHVESYIARDPGTVEGAVVMIAEVDWATAAQLPIAATSLFEVIARSSRMQAGAADGDGIDLVAMLRGKSPQEGEDALFQLFAGEIAAVLRIAPSEITRLKVVKDIGLDSLMAMELGMSFKQKTGFDLPLGSVTQGTTVGDISRKLYLKVTQRGDQQAEPRIEETQVVDMLASRHASSANAETG